MSEVILIRKPFEPDFVYAHREAISRGAAYTVALAVIVGVSTLASFTALPKMTSLSSFPPPALAGVLATCGIVGYGGYLAYERAGQPPPPEYEEIRCLAEVNLFEMETIKGALGHGFDNYLDYYAFYKHLSNITTEVLRKESPLLQQQWKTFLVELDGRNLDLRGHHMQVTLDTTFEQDRLDGEEDRLTIEELSQSDNLLFRRVVKICREGFQGISTLADEAFHEYFFRDEQRVFLAKNRGEAIVGVVIVKEASPKELKFHSMARKASAAHLKIGKLFLNWLTTQGYDRVKASVLAENMPARELYRDFGFVEKKPSEEERQQDPRSFFNIVYRGAASVSTDEDER